MRRTVTRLTSASTDLLVRAALVRKRALQLGGVGDYYVSASAPSFSNLVTAAPETTNTYIIAYGEKEGLAPGERLEIYGNRMRLVRILAYGCPRGLGPSPTLSTILKGNISTDTLTDLTRQLNIIAARFDAIDSQSGTTSFDSAPTSARRRRKKRMEGSDLDSVKGEEGESWQSSLSSSTAAVSPVWSLVPTEHGARAPLKNAEPAVSLDQPLGAEEVTRVLAELTHSNEEVVVAQWVKSVPTGASPAVSATIADTENLLIENGMCFSTVESAGLRVLRSARMAFMSNVERVGNSLLEVLRRRRGEDQRPLAILDVSAIDFSFSHAALQSTLAMGLHDESHCHITFVPLTDGAARSADAKLASFMRQVVQEPGKALRDPFARLPLQYFDIAAFTAYLDLRPSPNDLFVEAAHRFSTHNRNRARGSHQKCSSPSYSALSRRIASAEHKMLPRASLLRHRVDGQEDSQLVETPAVQLSRALACLHQGASVLVSFVPSPASGAAVFHETRSARRAEVLSEAVAVAHAKSCVAEAISRTGRWGCITDEILPAVDAPQGSAISLMITLD